MFKKGISIYYCYFTILIYWCELRNEHLRKRSKSVTGLVVQLCDTVTESRISATQHGPAPLPILLKQTRVAPDSYSRNRGLFKAMWSGMEVKGWLLGMFP